ncbi:MAG: ribonuclease R [Rhodospirillales bacterium]|nr:ribonuclease R [Rhodospirillales bacterium]
MTAPAPRKTPLPTREQLLDYLRDSATPVPHRDLARAFGLHGADRIWLKEQLRALAENGLLENHHDKHHAPPDCLPPVTVLEIAGQDEDGEVLARPVSGPAAETSQVWEILLAPDRGGQPPALGERILARLTHLAGQRYRASIIRRLGGAARRLVGRYERVAKGSGLVVPADRRVKEVYRVREANRLDADEGELVLIEPLRGSRRDQDEARVLERLGSGDSPKAYSLVAMAEYGLRDLFPKEALEEANTAGPVPLGDRLDLRDLPLITIDGADARDFDDAVFAEPDPDPANPGGFRILVAIADVAHYVRANSALDREARKRGNSTYFPDRVVPMLPEALSNGWCSLKPDEERPCLVAEMWIDRAGQLKRHHFQRALMRSAARLTYEAVQEAIDGHPDALTEPLLDPVLRPLHAACKALDEARAARSSLDLEIVERQVVLDAEDRPTGIVPRARLASHRLIELFMVTANVAAAETLEAKRQACMYRVHQPPDAAKVEALGEVLRALGLAFAKGQPIRPQLFCKVLDQVKGSAAANLVGELVLRSQSQAFYAPDNEGHFGLALQRYAHFTSPIRRYADLLVHRALIGLLELGPDGLAGEDAALFAEWGASISKCERRSAMAERDTLDRFTAQLLSKEVGSMQKGRIAGVARFGLFVRLAESGADGLVPIGSLPDDRYEHDARLHALIGRRWGRVYRLGEAVMVRLREANALTGSLIMELTEGEAGPSPWPRGSAPKPSNGPRTRRPPQRRSKAKGRQSRRKDRR